MTLGFTCETHCYQANTIIISVLCNTLQTSLLKKLTLGPVDRSEDRLQQLWKLTNFHNRAQSVTLQKKTPHCVGTCTYLTPSSPLFHLNLPSVTWDRTKLKEPPRIWNKRWCFHLTPLPKTPPYTLLSASGSRDKGPVRFPPRAPAPSTTSLGSRNFESQPLLTQACTPHPARGAGEKAGRGVGSKRPGTTWTASSGPGPGETATSSSSAPRHQ